MTFSWWLVFFLRFWAHACSIHLIRVDTVFCMLCVCACWYSAPITGGQWVDLCVNQWSGIGHCHPRVSMHMGSACAWKACMDRNECIRVINRHRWQQQFWKCQCVEYNRDWCALTWNLTLTFIYQVICVILPAMVMWGTGWWQYSLIRSHTLQLVVWNCYFTCPNLLTDLVHLIQKICCMCVCAGFTSSKFGHIRYWLVLVH